MDGKVRISNLQRNLSMNFEKDKFTGGEKGKGWWGISEGWWGISPPVNMLKNALHLYMHVRVDIE